MRYNKTNEYGLKGLRLPPKDNLKGIFDKEMCDRILDEVISEINATFTDKELEDIRND